MLVPRNLKQEVVVPVDRIPLTHIHTTSELLAFFLQNGNRNSACKRVRFSKNERQRAQFSRSFLLGHSPGRIRFAGRGSIFRFRMCSGVRCKPFLDGSAAHTHTQTHVFCHVQPPAKCRVLASPDGTVCATQSAIPPRSYACSCVLSPSPRRRNLYAYTCLPGVVVGQLKKYTPSYP